MIEFAIGLICGLAICVAMVKRIGDILERGRK